MEPGLKVLVGVLISIAGSTFNCFGQNVQKWAQEKNDLRPAEEKKTSYTGLPLWWGGLGFGDCSACTVGVTEV